ncbi:hypothetical protein [Stutzerimonas balearica]|uniref:Uncharacterized protein n=1 Tax=Stutzerimonas balearica TaxID=74829 RepID=A0A9X7UYZ7_9GAMM|nr:hypothetical protein [Stutzerimonas balearica]QQN49050.1 hypothetical protein I6H70_10715 [Stutzerimonas balearica]
MTKTPLALVTALLASGLALPSLAAQQSQGQTGMQTQQQSATAGQHNGGISIRVGHDIVDAVDDIRENVADLVGSLRESGEDMGLANWSQNEGRLAKMEETLQQEMEHKLDDKADRTDDSWKSWITGDDYKVTVTKQVNQLAGQLDEIAKMLDGAKGGKMQQIVSATVVDQVDDLQETVEDLVVALEDADGLSINNQHLQDARKRLDKMEQELDRNADLDDARWSVYATGDQFTPGIQKNVSELAQTLRSLFQQGARCRCKHESNRPRPCPAHVGGAVASCFRRSALPIRTAQAVGTPSHYSAELPGRAAGPC